MKEINIFVLFAILNIVNVVLSTIKSLATVKGGKFVAAFMNAISYGFYTIVLVYINIDGLSLLNKCLIVGACNFIGVFIVKWIEEIAKKDKLWKVEMTVPSNDAKELHKILDAKDIPHNYIENLGKWTLFSCYCTDKKASANVKELCKQYNAKFFISENKETWNI